MTTYRVLLERTAEKDRSRLSSEIHDRVIKAIQALATNPRPPGCRKLVGDIPPSVDHVSPQSGGCLLFP